MDSNFFDENIQFVFYAFSLFCFIAMIYVSIKSDYKIGWKIWIKSFLIGFICFSVFVTTFLILPILFLNIPSKEVSDFIYYFGPSFFGFSYLAMALYGGFLSFREDNAAMIHLNCWVDAQRQFKKRKKENYDTLQ